MCPRVRAVTAAIALAWSLSACNGSPSRPPSTPPPSGGDNPCSTASIEESGYVAPLASRAPGVARRKEEAIDGTPRWRVLDALWTHQAHGRPPRPGYTDSGRTHLDVGDIAIVPDEGDVVVPANAYDLRAL